MYKFSKITIIVSILSLINTSLLVSPYFETKSLTTNEVEISSFTYSYTRYSHWWGSSLLKTSIYDNKTIYISYNITAKTPTEPSFFLWDRDFERTFTLADEKWKEFEDKIKLVNNWSGDIQSDIGHSTDGPLYREVLQIFDSMSFIVHTSVYELDYTGITGRHIIPADSSVIQLMEEVRNYVISLENNYRSDQLFFDQISTFLLGFGSVLIVAIFLIIIKTRRNR